MSFSKYALPASAVAGRAAAQSSCSAATTTIQNAGDASALASCTTFTGSIAIATGTTDNIALDGIQKIQGSLIANNVTGMTQLSAGDLETITDSFTLSELTVSSSLTFPVSTNVDMIEWTALPASQQSSFTNGVQTASQVSIQNTQSNTLDGINLQVVDQFFIANNNYLENIEMQLGNITTSLILESNGKNVSAIFPNLDWAYNMTFRNCSQVSIPSLASLNGSMGFYSNEFSTLNAPNLTTVGGTSSFVSNTDLSNVTMPSLKSVGGGFQIANNTEFKIVNGFPKLATVGGALDFYGNFTNVTLPSSSDVRGAFNLQSSADITDDCSTFQSSAGSNNVIKGTFTCAGEQAKPSGQGSTPSSTGSSSSSSSTHSSGAIPMYIPTGAAGFMGVVAAVFGIF